MLTVAEAARFLNTTHERLIRWAAAGEVPAVGRGRIFSFDREELTAWIRSQYAEPWRSMFRKPVPMSEDVPGIYFLRNAEEIVYVGQSNNIKRRVREHLRKARIQFDNGFFRPCQISELDALEMHYLHAYKPPYNKQLVRSC